MIRHTMIWRYKDGALPSLPRETKESLEALVGLIDGLISAEVSIDALPSSSADAMIVCTFENADALRRYKSHPSHIAIVDRLIRPFCDVRLSFDETVE